MRRRTSKKIHVCGKVRNRKAGKGIRFRSALETSLIPFLLITRDFGCFRKVYSRLPWPEKPQATPIPRRRWRKNPQRENPWVKTSSLKAPALPQNVTRERWIEPGARRFASTTTLSRLDRTPNSASTSAFPGNGSAFGFQRAPIRVSARLFSAELAAQNADAAAFLIGLIAKSDSVGSKRRDGAAKSSTCG